MGSAIGKFAGGLFAIDKAFDLLKQGLGVVSDFQRMDASLSAVSSSSLDFARSQSFLRGLSDTLGISIETLTGSFKGLKAATNGTVLQGAATEKIFTSVVHAGAALKLSNDDIKGSLLALTQMMSKGTVSAEELRGQLGERLPGAFRLMAQGLGVTEVQLNKMLQQGEVLAVDALPKLAVELEKTYGAQAQNNVNSMAGGWQRATDQVKLYIDEFSKTAGIDNFFTKLSNGLANAVASARELNRQGLGGGIIGGLMNTHKSSVAEDAGRMRTEFGTLNSGQQVARLQMLEEQIKSTGDTMQKVILIPLLNDLKKIYQGNRREDRNKAALITADAGPARFNLKEAKDKRDALADKIANGLGNHENVSKLQSDWAKLNAEIERVTGTTKKAKKEFSGKTTWSVLETLERGKKLLEDDIGGNKALKGFVPPELAHELERLEAQIKRIKGETKTGLLKVSTKSFDEQIYGQASDRRKTFGSALSNRAGEVGNYGSSGFFQDQLAKIQAIVQQGAGLGRKIIDPQALQLAQNYAGELAKIDNVTRDLTNAMSLSAMKQDPSRSNGGGLGAIFGSGGVGAESVQKMMTQFGSAKDGVTMGVDLIAQAMEAGRQQLRGAAVGLLTSIGDSIGKGEDPLKAGLKVILDALGGFIIQLGEALLFSSAALLAAAPLTFGITLAPGLAQDLAGAGLIVAGAAVKGFAGSFEGGGLFQGESLIRVGESQKALKGGGEFVAPVELGANLISKRIMQNMGGLRTQAPTAETGAREIAANIANSIKLEASAKLLGSDIYLSLKRTEQNNKTFGRG